MKDKFVIFILTILTFVSCSTDNKVESSLFDITYTSRVKPKSAQEIAEYISFRQKHSGYLDGVSKIKIDSNFYSYQLFLAGHDSILKKNAFQAFAKLMSDDLLDSAAVHIFITDDSFSDIKIAYKFSDQFISYGRQEGVSRNLKISFPGEMGTHVPRALFDELRVNQPELLKNGDTLIIDIDRKGRDYTVDIYVNTENLNVEILRRQFKEAYCASLIYDILFEYNTTYITVHDRKTKDPIFVAKHGSGQ
jgi:hypothetical protein